MDMVCLCNSLTVYPTDATATALHVDEFASCSGRCESAVLDAGCRGCHGDRHSIRGSTCHPVEVNCCISVAAIQSGINDTLDR